MAPMAVASDGTLLLNIAITDGATDPRQLLERALAPATPVFVAVVATAGEVAVTSRWMDDATVEVVGAIWDGRGRRHRPTRSRR